jgi:hypothetical protein
VEDIMNRSIRQLDRWFIALGFGVASALSMAPVQATPCGGVLYPFPYTDVSAVGAPFCPGIMEAYVTGVSRGTSPTTFSPNENVPRLQMTTFLQRSLDQGLARTSRRAALDQWWTPQNTNVMQNISVGGALDFPYFCAADGEKIWTSTYTGNAVVEVQASTGKVLGTWKPATGAAGVRVVGGMVFAAGATVPGSLYLIDGGVSVYASNLGAAPNGMAFDGTNLWTANIGIPNPCCTPGSVSIITPQNSFPFPVTTITTGFTNPAGILYDGAHIWVTDAGAGKLLKLDASGNILQTVTVGSQPLLPVFDGANIWVPNSVSNSITVVQASSGNVVATIASDASNQLNSPRQAAFDGERVLVTNFFGDSVTLFKAADLSFIASVKTGTGTNPIGACSDGINFWVTLSGSANLLRF